VIGINKKKCENLIIKNKKKFEEYQIWRPFNLVGTHYSEHTDHFHNLLFKKMFIMKNGYSVFKGNMNDMRGYSRVGDFVRILFDYSKTSTSFVKDFGNQKLCKIGDIVKLYNKYYFKLFKKNFCYKFISTKTNINIIKKNKNNFYKNLDSLKIIDQYLKNSLNVKKV
jgi:nucleoside-diphosphate-sugar epimerase